MQAKSFKGAEFVKKGRTIKERDIIYTVTCFGEYLIRFVYRFYVKIASFKN